MKTLISILMVASFVITAQAAVPAKKTNGERLNLHLPRNDQKNYYYWYYGCLATFLHGGEVWDEWNKKMKPIFLEKQQADNRLMEVGRPRAIAPKKKALTSPPAGPRYPFRFTTVTCPC